MGGFDVLVRGGQVVGPRGVAWADAVILDGLVAEIGPDLAGAAGIEIDAEVVSYDPRRGLPMVSVCLQPFCERGWRL